MNPLDHKHTWEDDLLAISQRTLPIIGHPMGIPLNRLKPEVRAKLERLKRLAGLRPNVECSDAK